MQAPQTEILIRAADGSELLRTTLPPGEYVLGCEAGCDLRFEAEFVAQRHAQITVNFDHALIEDLGSGSGTSVNGKSVTEATRLWPGQRIQIGSATVELRRMKTLSAPDVSLAPNVAITRDILPEEILRDRKYDIGGEVARGGMGAILNAKESAIQRAVAMKVMLDNASPDDLVRFIAEARVTGQLEHPNIVPVHELGVDENEQVFYTMKFVKGITLRKVLEAMAEGEPATIARYPLATLLTIFQKVCDAVAFAHSKGVIHRDLKPENIMLGDFGEVLLMDWGLAKVIGGTRSRASQTSGGHSVAQGRAGARPSDRSLLQAMPEAAGATMGGAILGTPQYMAPEQARGEVETLDARADIYGLGAILYHIVALRPSVRGDDPYTVVETVARGEIEPLVPTTREHGSAAPSSTTDGRKAPLRHLPGGRIPDSLAAVVRKAMAFEKAQRYETVADLQADLAAYQAGFATKAEAAGLGKQLALLIRRNKGIFTTAFAAWLLITALAIWFVLNLRAKEQRATAGETAARRALANSALALAEASLREANGPEMEAALNVVPEDLRESTWSYLLAEADSSIARISTSTNEIEGAAADPTRPGVFAVSDRTQKVTLLNVQTGERLLEFLPEFREMNNSSRYRLAFSRDGQRLAVGRDGPGGIVIHRVSDGAKEREWPAPSWTEALEFGSDQRLLQATKNSIHVWDTAAGQLLWEMKREGNLGIRAAFLPNGKEVLRYDHEKRLVLVSAADGSVVRELGGRSSAYDWEMAIRGDGKAVLTCNEDQLTECLSLEDGRRLFALPEKRKRMHLATTSDGTRFVTVSPLAEGLQSIEVWNAQTGDLLHSLLGGSGEVRVLCVHPRSSEMLVTGPKSRAWDLTGEPPAWRFGHEWKMQFAFWGSDDLVYGQTAGNSKWALQRLKPGGMDPVWLAPKATSYASAVSADGRIVALGDPGFSDEVELVSNPGPEAEVFRTVKVGHWPYRLRLSPNGHQLATTERVQNQGLRITDTSTGEKAFEPELPGQKWVNDLQWLTNERLLGLVTVLANRGNPGSEERILLWDTATGKIVQSMRNRTPMETLAVAPDGRRFAEAGMDKNVRIRDGATLAMQSEFRAHDAPITELAWHPTQPILATASADLLIRLWNIDTGKKLEEFRGPLEGISQLAFSPGGQRLGCSSYDGVARVWEPRSLRSQPVPEKEPAPLPAPTTETGDWTNLIAQLTPAGVAQLRNGWRLDGGVLFTPDNRNALLPLPGDFSGTSYQMRVKLRQLTPKDSFNFQFPVGDRMVGFDLDGFPDLGHITGLAQVTGLGLADQTSVSRGKQVRDSELHDLEMTVRIEGANATVSFTLDGTPLYVRSGPIADLSQFEGGQSPAGVLALRGIADDWVIHEVKARRLDPEQAAALRIAQPAPSVQPPPIPTLQPGPDGWADVLATLTPEIVRQHGNGWRLRDGALFSPKTQAVLPLAAGIAGSSYQVRMKLRQVNATEAFNLGLPVGKRTVVFYIDGFPWLDFYSSLMTVNEKDGRDIPQAVRGKVVKDSEWHELEVTVRLADPDATITAQLDQRPLYEWTGPMDHLKIGEFWRDFSGDKLAIGTLAPDWIVSEVKVKRLDGK